jgi:nucleotide-binding universal stress UspA family protein
MSVKDSSASEEAVRGIGITGVPNLIHTVLLATDGTAYADQALKDCINLLKNNDGKLIITYFADPKDVTLYQGSPCSNDAEWRTKGKRILDRLATKAREGGVKDVSTLLEEYQGEESLNQIAKEVDANLIMLSSHLFQFDN